MSDRERIINDLEHDTIRPFGEHPEHCAGCSMAADIRHWQATCKHPEDRVQEVEIRAMCDPTPNVVRSCGLCGKELEGRPPSDRVWAKLSEGRSTVRREGETASEAMNRLMEGEDL